MSAPVVLEQDPDDPEDPDGLGALVALVQAALPGETLGADDLEGLLVGTPTVLLRTAEGDGAALLTVRGGEPVRAHLQLVVVHPSRRRRGIARALVRAAEDRAAALGARRLHVGGAAPVYLFTGVDAAWTEALCCFEGLGYQRAGLELDLVCPTRGATRVGPPAGVQVQRVRDEGDAAELRGWAERTWPAWAEEFGRAAEAGTVVVARAEDGQLLGAAAHSVGRLGVVGPVAVDPAHHCGGVGAALMSEVLAELSTAGLDRAEIAWVSTVRFYARSCGARVGRTSVLLARDIDPPDGPVASSP